MKKLQESERMRREAEEEALAAKREAEEREGGEEQSEGSKDQEDSEVKTDAALGTNASRGGSPAGTMDALDPEERLKKEELDEGKMFIVNLLFSSIQLFVQVFVSPAK